MKRVPETVLLGTYRRNVYPKTGFWVHVGMAGVDGIKPPSADLESAVLLTELNSLRRPGEELRPCLRTAGKPMGSRIITKGAGKQAGVAPAWAMSHQVALRLRDTGIGPSRRV